MNRPVVLLASLLVASLALGQDNNILSSYRVLPKPGKDADLRKALTAHAAKYHKGDWRWRVLQVASGPEEGAYQMNEGPASWTALEGRKDISDEHTRDYETTVLPLVEKTFPASYSRYEGDLSTSPYAGKFKKVLIRHLYLKPGKGPQFRNDLVTWKKVFEKTGRSVTVWSSFFSGQPRFDVAQRLAQGWADLEHMDPQQLQKAFTEVGGEGALGVHAPSVADRRWCRKRFRGRAGRMPAP